MKTRSVGLALLLAASIAQADSNSNSVSSHLRSNIESGSDASIDGTSTRSGSNTRPGMPAAEDRSGAIDGLLPEVSEALSRALDARLLRETEAAAIDLVPAPVAAPTPSVASIYLP